MITAASYVWTTCFELSPPSVVSLLSLELSWVKSLPPFLKADAVAIQVPAGQADVAPYGTDGSLWHQVGFPQHSGFFLPMIPTFQPPFVLPIPAGYFYHDRRKKVMLFLCILS